MKYLHVILIMTLFISANTLYAQQTDEQESIKKTINQLFEGMQKTDSILMRGAFNQGAILQTIAKSKDGKTTVRTENLDAFIKSIALIRNRFLDERIVFTKILIDDNLASVWTDYQFYINEKFSHCGVNSFQLVKTEAGWKIVYLIDTRRKENCN